MTEFVWTQQLSIGVEPMDHDHQKIIALMNELEKAYSSNASFSAQDRAFKNLAEFTRKHFRDEEAYMESIDFPQLASHKMIHEKLLGNMEDHYLAFRQSQKLDEQVFTFLRFWLKSHICGIDRKYAELSHALAS